MSNPAAEKYLKQVRKLPSNLHCPNCGSDSTTNLGFGSVCVKFKTFICDLCKTSHQAISHRVKSVSMSEWTMEEVKELTAERSGGNAAALHTWLLNAPEVGRTYPGGKRPKKGDDVNIFKQFIVDCYEHGKFRAQTPFDPSSVVEEISSPSGSSASSPRPGATSPVPRAHPNAVPVRRVAGSGGVQGQPRRPAPAPVTAAPAVNLLDMSDDPMPAATGGSASMSVNTNDLFSTGGSDGGFDAFSSPNPNTAAGTDFDSMFGAAEPPAPITHDVPATAAPVDVFASDSFGSSQPQRSTSAPIDPFADFGGAGAGVTPSAGVNNNNANNLNSMIFGGNGNSNSNNISNMGGMTNNGMNRGGGMGNSMGGQGGMNNMGMNRPAGSSVGGGMGNSMGGGMGNSVGGGMGNSVGGGMGNSVGGGMGNSMGGMGNSMGGGMGNSMGGGMGNSMGGGMGNSMGGMGNSMGGGMRNSMGGGMGNSMGGGMGNSMGGGMGMSNNAVRSGQPGATSNAGGNSMSSMMNNQLLGMNSMKSNSYTATQNQNQGGYGGGYGGKSMGGNGNANTNVFDFVSNEMKKK